MDPATENNAEFTKPPLELLGLKLRPYSAGTAALMDQARWTLRQLVNEQYGETPAHAPGCEDKKCVDDCKKNRREFYAHFYYLAAWVFIHAEPLPAVCAACWKPGALLPALTEFIARFDEKQILSCNDAVVQAEDDAKRASNYKVEGADDAQPPNE